MGPVGSLRTPMPEDKERLSRLADLLKKLCDRPDADGRFFLVTALTLLQLGDPAWTKWITRALDRPEPEDLVGRRTEMRVVSEAARAADQAGRRDLLDAAAKRFIV